VVATASPQSAMRLRGRKQGVVEGVTRYVP
jgi:hypothetical protein